MLTIYIVYLSSLPSSAFDRWNQIDDHGTSHLSIVDSEQNAVSMTSTVNSYFGAQILSPSTGIVLNNEMSDFSMPENNTGNVSLPAPSNFIRPGKRPLSSMTPTIVLKVCCFVISFAHIYSIRRLQMANDDFQHFKVLGDRGFRSQMNQQPCSNRYRL